MVGWTTKGLKKKTCGETVSGVKQLAQGLFVQWYLFNQPIRVTSIS